jgi:hypothetical protein
MSATASHYLYLSMRRPGLLPPGWLDAAEGVAVDGNLTVL